MLPSLLTSGESGRISCLFYPKLGLKYITLIRCIHAQYIVRRYGGSQFTIQMARTLPLYTTSIGLAPHPECQSVSYLCSHANLSDDKCCRMQPDANGRLHLPAHSQGFNAKIEGIRVGGYNDNAQGKEFNNYSVESTTVFAMTSLEQFKYRSRHDNISTTHVYPTWGCNVPG